MRTARSDPRKRCHKEVHQEVPFIVSTEGPEAVVEIYGILIWDWEVDLKMTGFKLTRTVPLNFSIFSRMISR